MPLRVGASIPLVYCSTAPQTPREAKIDPELPESLNATQRQRKVHLLESGLSDHYVGLCFEGMRPPNPTLAS